MVFMRPYMHPQASMHGVHQSHVPPCCADACPGRQGGQGRQGGVTLGDRGVPGDRGDRALPDPLEQPPGPTTKHAPRLLLQTRVVAKGYASSSTKVMTSVLLNAHLPLFCSPTIRDPSLEILGNRESPRKCPRNLSAFSRLSLYR